MNAFEFPYENYTIIALVGFLSIIYLVILVCAIFCDRSENTFCKIEFLQDDIHQKDTIYSISMTIKECICSDNASDIIFRLRGKTKDSPLILFKNQKENKYKNIAILNLGIALPFNLGDLVEMDIASNNDACDENVPVLSISNVYVRKLPSDILSYYSCGKQRILCSLFNTFDQDLLCWVCIETITNKKGIGIMGFSKVQKGKAYTLRARDTCLSLPLTKENSRLRKRSKVSYQALHYFCSLSSTWHDTWSDFSAFDQILVMFLDQLMIIILISCSFAYALENYFGVMMIRNAVKKLFDHLNFACIEEFDFYLIFSGLTSKWFLYNALNIAQILWTTLISSFFVVPVSLILCRLFRLIGGKNFNHNNIDRRRKISKQSKLSKEMTASSLMLRTLECRSIHTGSSVTSFRRLRTEPMICNCSSNQISPRVIAYIRTKMARLRERDLSVTDIREPKGSKVLHESHTQTTDAPHMPLPVAAPNKNGDVEVVARYCERLVQQATEHVRDRSVIAECIEVNRESRGCDAATSTSDSSHSLLPCCPRQCRKRNQKCRQENFSNSNFFSEEDAASVKEMISNFSLTTSDELREEKIVNKRVKKKTKQEINKEKQKAAKSKDSFSSLTPSAGILKISQSPSRKASSLPEKNVSLKNSGTEPEPRKNSKNASDIRPRTSLSESRGRSFAFKRGLSLPTVLIGRERSTASETGVTWKKMKNRLYDAMTLKLRNNDSRKNNKVPQPSAFPSSPVRNFTFSGDEMSSVDKKQTGFDEKKKLICKGVKFKMIVFFFLLLFMTLSIFFLTAYKNSNNHFFQTQSDALGNTRQAGRFHAATLACLLGLVLYYIFTVHLIGLCSFLLEFLVFLCFSKKNVDVEVYYESKSDYSVV